MQQRALICALVLVAFGGNLFGPFQFDDFGLLSDPAITLPSGWQGTWSWTQTRPLAWITFWLNYQLGGDSPFGYHLVNLALHMTVACLLLNFLLPLTGVRAAFIASLLFAVHPAIGEPVNYISARPILLAAVFVLLALRAWVREHYCWAVVGCALAMLSKEECASLPLIFILHDKIRARKSPVGATLAAFGITAVLGLRVVWAAANVNGSQAGAQAGIAPLDYALAQGLVVWRYLGHVILPWGFTPDYEIIVPPAWLGILGWLVLATVAAVLVRRAKWTVWIIAGLILLLPSSSIFPAADLMADRRLYLPMLAFSSALGLWLSRRGNVVRACVLLPLLAISMRYSLLWRSPEGLWRDAVVHAPHKARPRIQLARSVVPQVALGILAEAQQLAPEDPVIANEQGRVLLGIGLADQALTAFGRALALDPSDARAISNRGAALQSLGQTDAARADYARALAQNPCLFDALLNLRRLQQPVPAHERCRFSAEQLRLLGM